MMDILEKQAFEILKMFCKDGCIIADSGGKDSSVLKHVALKARDSFGLKFSIVHNLTTVDAPETVYFVYREKERFEKLGIEYTINKPRKNMEALIVKNCIPPSRIIRYCCSELKESYGKGEKLVTGVRAAESISRKRNGGVIQIFNPKKELRDKVEESEVLEVAPKGGVIIHNYDNEESKQVVQSCFRTHKLLINPLLYWDDGFLWQYIKDNEIELNPLYKCGFNRVGCIGCPVAGKHRWIEFKLYPKYKERYLRAFGWMLEERKRKGMADVKAWRSAEHVFKWWMEDKNVDGQLSFTEDWKIYEDYVDYVP